MKKIGLLLCCVLFTSVVAYAQLNVVIQDGNLSIDTTGFPPKMKTAYSLMMNKCNQCHSLERIIVGVQSGICPLTKSAFNKESITAIVTRMFRKDNSNISREDAREILQLLEYLLNEKTTVVTQIAGKTDPVLLNISSSRNVERRGFGKR
jgi:hypothetical protein